MTRELVPFIETGEWDIPEVVVYSDSKSRQRDHDQKDPQHHWCGKFKSQVAGSNNVNSFIRLHSVSTLKALCFWVRVAVVPSVRSSHSREHRRRCCPVGHKRTRGLEVESIRIWWPKINVTSQNITQEWIWWIKMKSRRGFKLQRDWPAEAYTHLIGLMVTFGQSHLNSLSFQVAACRDTGYDWFEQLLSNVSLGLYVRTSSPAGEYVKVSKKSDMTIVSLTLASQVWRGCVVQAGQESLHSARGQSGGTHTQIRGDAFGFAIFIIWQKLKLCCNAAVYLPLSVLLVELINVLLQDGFRRITY